MSFRIAVDTGGTFSDVVVADDEGHFSLEQGADDARARSSTGSRRRSSSRPRSARSACTELLAQTEVLIYATTRSTNAIITGTTARTALITTRGLPGHARLPRGRQAAAVRLPPALSRAVHPEAADVRDAASGSRPRARS